MAEDKRKSTKADTIKRGNKSVPKKKKVTKRKSPMKKPVKQENREIKHDIDDGLDLDQDMESPGHEFDLREYKFL